MKFFFFDSIFESLVPDSLAAALAARGHDVEILAQISTGLETLSSEFDRVVLEEIGRFVISRNPDVVVFFRPHYLPSSVLDDLRSRGIHLVCWLSDDPVTYRFVAQSLDKYHLVLHGGTNVLSFYDSRGHAPGVVFPFWVSDTVSLRKTGKQVGSVVPQLVFFGRTKGRFKSHRFDLLKNFAIRNSILPQQITFFGDDDLACEKAGFRYGGFIEDPVTLFNRVREFDFSLNIAQRLHRYMGTRFDFGGIGEFGWFDVPSRVLQAAQAGVPQINVGCPSSVHFPVPSTFDSNIYRYMSEPDLTQSVLDASLLNLRNNFTSSVRAEYLEYLIETDTSGLSIQEREFGYQTAKTELVTLD